MSILLIRPALEAVLASIPGIASASGWPVEQANAVPVAIAGWDDDDITMASVQQDYHSLKVSVLVQRKGGNLKNQVIAVEELIEPFLATIRANQDLGLPNLVAMVEYGRVREDVYILANVDYVGFVVDLRIKTTQGVSFT